MSFTNGLLNLTNWTGNVILPTLAGLFFAIAILRFSRGESSTHAMYGGFLFLMVSGLLRAVETFASQRAWSDPDVYFISLLSLVNWICNVMMPLYGVLQIVVGITHIAGVGHRIYQGGSWMRHFMAAAGCFMLSGIVRLAEWFIEHGRGGIR